VGGENRNPRGIWNALEQLTPDQRAAVVLRYYLEEDEQAMVQELGRPLTTIKWWLHAARQRLRQILLPLQKTALDGQESTMNKNEMRTLLKDLTEQKAPAAQIDLWPAIQAHLQ
jgi:hypothetical protein